MTIRFRDYSLQVSFYQQIVDLWPWSCLNWRDFSVIHIGFEASRGQGLFIADAYFGLMGLNVHFGLTKMNAESRDKDEAVEKMVMAIAAEADEVEKRG